MVPSILDFGEGTLDCRFFCHLYMQLRLEKPISFQVRFNSKCRQNLGSLKAKSPNKIEFFSDYERYEMIDFNEGMCQSNEYYSCKSTNPSITTQKITTKSEVESSKPLTTITKPTIITESESTESITTSTINQTQSETTTKSIITTFTNATINATIKDTEIETTSENMTTVTVENQTITSNTKWQKIWKTTSVSNSELTTNNSIDTLKMLFFNFFIIFTILTFVIYVASMFLPITKRH